MIDYQEQENVALASFDPLVVKVLRPTRGDSSVDQVKADEHGLSVVSVVDGVEGLGVVEAQLFAQALQNDGEKVTHTGQGFASLRLLEGQLMGEVSGGFGVGVLSDEGCEVVAASDRGKDDVIMIGRECVRLKGVVVFSDGIYDMLADRKCLDEIFMDIPVEARNKIWQLSRSEQSQQRLEAVSMFFNEVFKRGQDLLGAWQVWNAVNYVMGGKDYSWARNLSIMMAEVEGDKLSPIKMDELTQRIEIDDETRRLCEKLVRELGPASEIPDNKFGVTFRSVLSFDLENGAKVVVKVPRHASVATIIGNIKKKEIELASLGVSFAKSINIGEYVIQPYVVARETGGWHDWYCLMRTVEEVMWDILPEKGVPRDNFPENVHFTVIYGPVVVDTA